MRAALIALTFSLSACAGIADQAVYSVSGGASEQPDFGVSALASGEDMPANYAAFNKVDPQVADFHARQVCTLGYEKLAEQMLAWDPGQLAWWRVTCVPYVLSL
jgi:hypothetical protein